MRVPPNAPVNPGLLPSVLFKDPGIGKRLNPAFPRRCSPILAASTPFHPLCSGPKAASTPSRQKQIPSSQFSMGPLIDCVFLLLIFFLVATMYTTPYLLLA
jgi:hypothetical protein